MQGEQASKELPIIFNSVLFCRAEAFTPAGTLLSDHEGCSPCLQHDDKCEVYTRFTTIRRHKYISSTAY